MSDHDGASLDPTRGQVENCFVEAPAKVVSVGTGTAESEFHYGCPALLTAKPKPQAAAAADDMTMKISSLRLMIDVTCDHP